MARILLIRRQPPTEAVADNASTPWKDTTSIIGEPIYE
jgi:hypothetical protein